MKEIRIKTVYIYYDKIYSIYNMFIFIEYCTIGFCIHRIAKNPKIFYTKNMMMTPQDGVFTYIFEDITHMSLSIYKLKKTLKNYKKISFTNNFTKYLDCFSCLSCNYFVYILSIAYDKEYENLIKYGLKYDYSVYALDCDKYKTNLQDCLLTYKTSIIKNINDLTTKISNFIKSKYNINLYYSEPEYYCDYICNKTGLKCNENNLCNDNIFHCKKCYNITDYNLCKQHNTIENRLKHYSSINHQNINEFINIPINHEDVNIIFKTQQEYYNRLKYN